ncbi:MAG TPA: multidrug effflux MFS transporter [Burkholderiales bacterium]|nr:multidrug effflux MFS transporter [Burkholderiales bacterium]
MDSRTTTPAFTVLLGVLFALTALGTDAWLPALPVAAQALDAPVARMQLTVTTYFLGLAGGQLVWGPLSDRYGRRPVLLAGLGLALAASAWCAASGTAAGLILGRLAQGLGMSAGPVISRAIVRDLHGQEQAARLLARMTIVFSVIPIAAPLAGGVAVSMAGWRAVFWLLGAIAALLLAAVAWRVAETVPAARASVHPVRLARAFGGIAADPRFLAPFGAMLCTQVGIFAFVSNSAFTLVSGMGVAPGIFSLLFALVMLGQISGAWLTSRWVARRGSARLLRLGTRIAFAAGAVGAAAAWAGASHPAWVVGPFMAYLFGSAFVVPNGTALALQPFPQAAGTAASLMGATQFAVGALVSAALGEMFDGTARPMATAAVAAGLASALLAGRFVRGPN